MSSSGKCANNKCLPNGILKRGSSLQSENNENKFILQENGDLVITCKGLVIWASSTWQVFPTNRIEGLYFSPEGNVMLYKEDKSLVWRTKTNFKSPKKLIIENDGNLVLYGDSKSKVWESDTRCKSTAHCECSTNGGSAFEHFDFRHKGSSDRDSEDFTEVARKSLEERKSGNFNKILNSIQESEEFGDNKDSY